jgi:hypothetical protein
MDNSAAANTDKACGRGQEQPATADSNAATPVAAAAANAYIPITTAAASIYASFTAAATDATANTTTSTSTCDWAIEQCHMIGLPPIKC